MLGSTRWLLLAAALPLLLGAGAPDLSEEESAELARGEAVTQWDGGEAVGVVDIAAPPETVLDAILDLEARKAEQSAIRSIDIYERSDDPERVSARFEVSAFSRDLVFHIAYEVDRASHTCTYSLDTSQENDMAASEGSYEISPTAQGSRLVYRSRSSTKRKTPEWVKRWLALDSLGVQLKGIKTRAEAGGS